MNHRVLAVNPTSSTTRVALFDGDECRLDETLNHPDEVIASSDRVWDQYLSRKEAILGLLAAREVPLRSLAAVVGRGGLLKPVEGGTYEVNPAMLEDLRAGVRGEHAANLGCLLAYGIAHEVKIPAYIVDPTSVDELGPPALVSGVPEIPRASLVHALNSRAVARRAAAELGKSYDSVDLIVVHLGSGISVSAHRSGRMIDVSNALEGGPFSPERAGTLPAGDLVRMCYSGRYSEREIVRKLTVGGGLMAYLGTREPEEIERRIEAGDPVAELVYEAMAYQVAKEIGAMATVLSGEVEAVVLTGPLASSVMLLGWIRERAGFIAPFLVYPGGEEMRALAQGVLRVLRGQEPARVYA